MIRTCRILAIAGSVLMMALAPALTAQAQGRTTAVATGSQPRLINLPRGSSFAVDLPADARDVIVSNPQVAEAMLHSPRRITIIGQSLGETDAVFLDSAGRTILALRVRVDAGTGALQDTLNRFLPGSTVQAEAVNDSIILSGMVANAAQMDQAQRIAGAFVSAPEKVLNMMTVAGSDQVTVRARVIEVQRSAVKQLGLNVSTVLNTVGDGLAFSQTPGFGVNGGFLGGTALNYVDSSSDGNRLAAGLRAFERAGLMRILAEPNATAVSGESAEFLAGGEFPIPVAQDGGANGARISIEFKPYGVRLAFRPVVQSEGRITLQLSTEVSELTTEGAFTLNPSSENSLVVPALSVRRATSTVELPSGGSLMIAGLLRETTRQNIDKLPALGDVPMLGSLFRSRDYVSGETELVIILEAYIVSPTSPGLMQTPADGMRNASDARAILLGQLSERYNIAPAAGAGTGWQGPVGYVIE